MLKLECGDHETDHAVTLVGYGKKNGENVWVVKNSWGKSWGANGFFYIRMGHNDFCIEESAFTELPKGYSMYNETLAD